MTDTDNTTSRAKELVVSAFAEFACGNTDILRSVLALNFVEHSPGATSIESVLGSNWNRFGGAVDGLSRVHAGR